MPRPNSTVSGTWLQTRTQLPEPNLAVVEFSFFPAYVETVWRQLPTASRTVREARSAYDAWEQERMLLDDSIAIDGGSMFVRVWLIPAREDERYHMRVEVTAPQIIVRSGRLVLTWADQEYVMPLRVGEMFFEDISAPDFSRLNHNLPSRRLRLRLEFDAHGKNGKH